MVVCVFKMFVLVTVQGSNLHKKFSVIGKNQVLIRFKKRQVFMDLPFCMVSITINILHSYRWLGFLE
jgi:hypothetical protein